MGEISRRAVTQAKEAYKEIKMIRWISTGHNTWNVVLYWYLMWYYTQIHSTIFWWWIFILILLPQDIGQIMVKRGNLAMGSDNFLWKVIQSFTFFSTAIPWAEVFLHVFYQGQITSRDECTAMWICIFKSDPTNPSKNYPFLWCMLALDNELVLLAHVSRAEELLIVLAVKQGRLVTIQSSCQRYW